MGHKYRFITNTKVCKKENFIKNCKNLLQMEFSDLEDKIIKGLSKSPSEKNKSIKRLVCWLDKPHLVEKAKKGLTKPKIHKLATIPIVKALAEEAYREPAYDLLTSKQYMNNFTIKKIIQLGLKNEKSRPLSRNYIENLPTEFIDKALFYLEKSIENNNRTYGEVCKGLRTFLNERKKTPYEPKQTQYKKGYKP
jgi:hypothetical protein